MLENRPHSGRRYSNEISSYDNHLLCIAHIKNQYLYILLYSNLFIEK